jgi:cell division protein FtsB
MSVKRILTFVILGVIFIFISVELVLMYVDARSLKKENETVEQKLQAVQKENVEIQNDWNYYQSPDNLEKNLREKFNYKKPGETMIIVVPPNQQ